ncbi:MAG: hypothetical protein ABSG46_11375 [Candidatus Binataceae bacterium]
MAACSSRAVKTRITQLAYAANGNSLGTLTYNYDADSRVVGKGRRRSRRSTS